MSNNQGDSINKTTSCAKYVNDGGPNSFAQKMAQRLLCEVGGILLDVTMHIYTGKFWRCSCVRAEAHAFLSIYFCNNYFFFIVLFFVVFFLILGYRHLLEIGHSQIYQNIL
jgi:hypothetical protein